ncbi:hypothetical protein LSH36_553g01067 [Paralvinella palmiformis]|uniref:Uncharacterized protein n=1 Tax=Paralvinella palmiformis TaxID=53620 RepID=A0AAD9J6M1_9ANNE|nr:hypothetical protein LSH36_553g01067 [Paralvinella palmiformis]
MATGGICEEFFSDITNCGICFEPLEDRIPRTLRCLHFFCEDCLQHLLDDVKVANPHNPDTDVRKQLEERQKLYHTQIPVTLSTMNSIFCDEHDAHVVYFCMTCTKAICVQCCMGRHSEHTVYDLTYDNKKTPVDLKEMLLSCLQSTDKTFEKFVHHQTKVINDLKQAMTDMTHHRDDFIKQINDQYDNLCLELQQKEAEIKLELSRSEKLVLDVRTSIENLKTKVDSWLEPVMGIPEGRIEDTAKLITDVKEQIPPFDINIKTETVKFMIGDDQIKLGEIVEEELKSLVVAGAISPFEGVLTKAVHNLGL